VFVPLRQGHYVAVFDKLGDGMAEIGFIGNPFNPGTDIGEFNQPSCVYLDDISIFIGEAGAAGAQRITRCFFDNLPILNTFVVTPETAVISGNITFETSSRVTIQEAVALTVSGTATLDGVLVLDVLSSNETSVTVLSAGAISGTFASILINRNDNCGVPLVGTPSYGSTTLTVAVSVAPTSPCFGPGPVGAITTAAVADSANVGLIVGVTVGAVVVAVLVVLLIVFLHKRSVQKYTQNQNEMLRFNSAKEMKKEYA
jgi:hypothetical protein